MDGNNCFKQLNNDFRLIRQFEYVQLRLLYFKIVFGKSYIAWRFQNIKCIEEIVQEKKEVCVDFGYMRES